VANQPTGRGVFTYAQLEQLWINAGGPRKEAPVAAAIAEAESAGRSSATNPTDNGGRQTSWGLWQISNGTHAQPVPNILDPNVNARQAVAKWKAAGNSFSPWGTFTSGAYRRFLSPGTTPDRNVPKGGGVSATIGGGSASAEADCWVQLPSVNLHVTSIGGGCLITRSQARHLAGGILMAAGGLVMLPGVLVLVAFTFRASGAAGKAADVTAKVPLPGAQAAAAGLQRADNQGKRTGGMALREQTAARRKAASEQAAAEKKAARTPAKAEVTQAS
jgi:hypothetical protein